MDAVNRRRFLSATATLVALRAFPARASVEAPGPAAARGAQRASGRYSRLLILIELKGGNDGLNTLVPYADPRYGALRPKIGIARDAVIPLSDRMGLHAALAPLLPLWQAGQLAVLQGVGYPRPNLSHFRSIEIWDTASDSDRYLDAGWLARTFAVAPAPPSFAADAIILGSNDAGPLAGGARAVTIADTGEFLRRARLAHAEVVGGNAALQHVLATENDIVHAAAHLGAEHAFATSFPSGAFGNAVRTAAQVAANPDGICALRLTLAGFDTHANQAPTHARLLGELAAGVVALRNALQELRRFDDTLIVTYAEFGRRARENLSGGTDHGTASVHFALGGRVAGGFYGAAPGLDHLSDDGNLAHAIDFRSVYATILDRWWNVDSRTVLAGRFESLPLIRA